MSIVRRALMTRLLLVLLLLLPGTSALLPPPVAAATTLGSTSNLPPGTTPGQSDATPALPSLTLTWSASASHVGVPVNLSLRLLDGDRQPATRTASVALILSDTLATVAGQSGTPVPNGARFSVALSNGQATVPVVFATPGMSSAFASLGDDPSITGSASLPVADVFFALDGPATLAADRAQPYTLSVRDDQGRWSPTTRARCW